MTILTTQDKDKIKRIIPKNTNKVIDATVARLYIAYPDPNQWQYTGLSGAIVLVDDLVGHTFFLKLVDLIGNRGVLWDQELYIDFQYNQDRSFFHSFEIDDCNVGLLFEDKSDASHFYKRVTGKDKHGSKKTIQNKNAIALKKKPDEDKQRGPNSAIDIANEQKLRRPKGVIYYDDLPPAEWRSFYKELETMGITEEMIAENREFIKDYISQRGGPLVGREPPIPRKYQFSNNLSTSRQRSSTITSNSSGQTPSGSTRRKKAPPPPPPPGAPSVVPSVPSNNTTDEYDFSPPEDFNPVSITPSAPSRTISAASIPETNPSPTVVSESSGFGHLPPPTKHRMPPPPANFAPPPTLPPKSTQSPFSPSTPSSVLPPGRGAVPPPPARSNFPIPPSRGSSLPPSAPVRGPALPPLPPGHHSRGPVPPPPPSRNQGPPPAPPSRTLPSAPHTSNGRSIPTPPPPRRGPAPPPPPSRTTVARPITTLSSQQPAAPALPSYPRPLPHQQPVQQQFQSPQQQQQSLPAPVSVQNFPPPPTRNVISSPPQTTFGQPPQAPPLPNAPQVSPSPTYSNPPAAPTLPPQIQQQSSVTPQAPPPPPVFPTSNGSGGPPPPPPPPPPSTMMTASSSSQPAPAAESSTGDPGRDALLSAIRGAGIGSLKKVDKSQLDNSNSTPKASSNLTGGTSGGQPSLTDALNAALSTRKKKVSHYDEDEDDW